MSILTVAIIALLIASSITSVCLSRKLKQLYDQVKVLERRANEVETFKEQSVCNLTNSLIKFYHENTDTQIKRVDEAIKIFNERRSALEAQMDMTRAMADTLVDAFKHRLDEAEKKYRD